MNQEKNKPLLLDHFLSNSEIYNEIFITFFNSAERIISTHIKKLSATAHRTGKGSNRPLVNNKLSSENIKLMNKVMGHFEFDSISTIDIFPSYIATLLYLRINSHVLQMLRKNNAIIVSIHDNYFDIELFSTISSFLNTYEPDTDIDTDFDNFILPVQLKNIINQLYIDFYELLSPLKIDVSMNSEEYKSYSVNMVMVLNTIGFYKHIIILNSINDIHVQIIVKLFDIQILEELQKDPRFLIEGIILAINKKFQKNLNHRFQLNRNLLSKIIKIKDSFFHAINMEPLNRSLDVHITDYFFNLNHIYDCFEQHLNEFLFENNF